MAIAYSKISNEPFHSAFGRIATWNSYCHSTEKRCYFVEKCCHFIQNANLQNGNTFLVIAKWWNAECKLTIAFYIPQNSSTIFHGKATLIAILQKSVAILWKSVAILPRMLLC